MAAGSLLSTYTRKPCLNPPFHSSCLVFWLLAPKPPIIPPIASSYFPIVCVQDSLCVKRTVCVSLVSFHLPIQATSAGSVPAQNDQVLPWLTLPTSISSVKRPRDESSSEFQIVIEEEQREIFNWIRTFDAILFLTWTSFVHLSFIGLYVMERKIEERKILSLPASLQFR